MQVAPPVSLDAFGMGNLFVAGLSRFARYLVGGDLLFDGGMVLTD